MFFNFYPGEEYVEDVKSDNGKVIGYKCTLCDCRFNDTIAKTAHVKGRRHRLSYKVLIQFIKLKFVKGLSRNIFYVYFVKM